MRIRLVVLLTVAATTAIGAQSRDVNREILAARDTVWRAWYTNDTTLLRRFIPPAAATLEGSSEARWNNRNDIVAGARGFAKSGSRFVNVSFGNTRIERVGNTALVQSTYRVITESTDRRDTTTGRAMEMFVRQGDTWLNPYWQLDHGSDGAGREIALPDTLGANFSIADSASNRATLTDYDALLGTWEFRYQSRAENGSFYPSFVGHWTFEKKPGGGLIEDRWRPDDPTSPIGNSLYTYRTFDPKRGVWFMLGTSSRGGGVEPGLTWSDGTSRYAIQRSGNELMRIRYLAITDTHFLWRSDRSVDGGKTWLLDAGTMEAKRIAK